MPGQTDTQAEKIQIRVNFKHSFQKSANFILVQNYNVLKCKYFMKSKPFLKKALDFSEKIVTIIFSTQEQRVLNK